MFFVYSILTAIGMLVTSPYFLLKGLRRGKYLANLGARFGTVPPEVKRKCGGCIWIHSVSVGEVLAALPLARDLKKEFPDKPLVISTTTETGQKLARERMEFADGVIYFPFDWAWAARRVMRALRPACVVILETEIWPNFLRVAHREGVPVIFANGRISDRSMRRYSRLLSLFGFVLRPFLRKTLSYPALFLAQTDKDAARVEELGMPPDRVRVTGNLKYDSPEPPESEFGRWLARAVEKYGRRPLIVAGSVTAGEEPLVLIAFGVLQGEMRNAFLVLAPRKPDRFDAAAKHIEESQRGYIRRSAISPASNDGLALSSGTSVLLLDSIGELAGIYRCADAVYVGGSMVPAGGHNVLEPAGFGKPPLFGTSMENFSGIADLLLARHAARRVENPEDLGVAWIELIGAPEKNRAMGEAARAIVEENRGATRRTVDQIAGVLRGRSRA